MVALKIPFQGFTTSVYWRDDGNCHKCFSFSPFASTKQSCESNLKGFKGIFVHLWTIFKSLKNIKSIPVHPADRQAHTFTNVHKTMIQIISVRKERFKACKCFMNH